MSLVTKLAPKFSAKAVKPSGVIEELKLSDYHGKYVLLFFYPADFSFVCPTEIIAFNKMVKEFHELNTELISVSVDNVFSHFAWQQTPIHEGGIGKVDFPMVSDITKKISADYGVLLEDAGISLRGLFLIDQNGIVRHELVNDLPLGRSVEEAKRMVQSLQFFEKYGEVCPANWHNGARGMKPNQQGLVDYSKSIKN